MIRQLRAFGPKDLRVVQAGEPELTSAHDVLVDVYACGICGSDKWYWSVSSPAKTIAGHEVAGKVVGVGSEVRRLKVGDRVAVNNVRGCGACRECMNGRYVHCAGGVTHIGGGFSERIVVPAVNCLLLDEETSDVEGSLIFDNWGTPYAAIQRAGVKSGDVIVVIGCGPIGLAAVSLTKVFGARVMAIDPIPERREAAARMGAERSLHPSEATQEAVRSFSQTDGADIILECSGKASSYELAHDMLRIGGTLAAIGEGALINWTSSMLIHKHLTISGSLYSSMQDGLEIQRLMRTGKIDPLSIVTHQFTIDELPAAFGDIVECRNGIMKSVMVRHEV